MSRLGRVVAAGVGVVALAALAWHGVGRVEAGSGEAESGEARDRAGLTALSAGGQTAGQLGGPTIEVYSRETVVDVTVVDKDGKPVHGLAQADFSVMEDGRRRR